MYPSVICILTPSPIVTRRLPSSMITDSNSVAENEYAPIVRTVAGILIGVWQFNKGQKNMQNKELKQRQFELKKMQIGNQFEAIAKFKELQSIKYTEASETISNIIYTENYQSDEFLSFL